MNIRKKVWIGKRRHIFGTGRASATAMALAEPVKVRRVVSVGNPITVIWKRFGRSFRETLFAQDVALVGSN